MKTTRHENYFLSSLKPCLTNPKIHTDEQVSHIAASIEKFGFQQPIVADENGEIIIGHGRYQAALRLKLTEVPVWIINGMNEHEKIALRIADNKINQETGFDEEILSSLMKELSHSEQSFIDIGLDFFEQAKQVEEQLKDKYTKKIVAPIYHPTRECPKISELYDDTKAAKLFERFKYLQESNPELFQFLVLASYRHVRFDFQNIAEYYAHAPKEIQLLMEESALVIIDFKKAIENGFVILSEELLETYTDGE